MSAFKVWVINTLFVHRMPGGVCCTDVRVGDVRAEKSWWGDGKIKTSERYSKSSISQTPLC